MRIEYSSPLARAQKSQIAQGFQQVIATLEPLAKLGPEIAQQLFGPIDVAKITPALFDWFGVDDALLKEDTAMTQQNQQQNMMKMMQTFVPMLAKAFKEGGQGVDAIASAGKQGVETAGMAQQMPVPMLPPPAQGGPAPAALPCQGGLNIQELIGSLVGGAQKVAPMLAGPPGAARRAAA